MKRATTTITALLLSALLGAQAAGTPAGSTISNTAYLDLNDGSTTTTINSSPVLINVTQLANISITPDGTTASPGQTVLGTPGQTAFTTYTACNIGNGSDTINLSAGTNQSAGVLYYADTNNNNIYDAGTDQQITSTGILTADQCFKFFAVYPVPTNTSDTTNIYTDPKGTSSFTNTVTDSDNVGLIDIIRVIDVTLSPSDTLNSIPSTGSYSFDTATLTNTGNTTLTAAEITMTTTVTNTTGGSVSYTVSGSGGTFTGTNLESLVDSAVGSGLTAGGTITITTILTGATGGAPDQSSFSNVIQAYSPVTASSSVVNNALNSDTSAQITDSGTVARGIGAATKKVATCTSADITACGTFGAGPVNRQPGQYAAYELVASNSGTGNLTAVKLYDILPTNFVVDRISATTNVTGTIVYSTDGTNWSSTAPAANTLTSGSKIYVAVNNAPSDSVIDSSDTFKPGGNLTLNIYGRIQ